MLILQWWDAIATLSAQSPPHCWNSDFEIYLNKDGGGYRRLSFAFSIKTVETLLTSDHTGLPLVQLELLCLCYVLVPQNFPSSLPVALSAVGWSDIVAGQVGLICLPYFSHRPKHGAKVRFAVKIMIIQVNSVCCRVAQVMYNLCHLLSLGIEWQLQGRRGSAVSRAFVRPYSNLVLVTGWGIGRDDSVPTCFVADVLFLTLLTPSQSR